MSTHQPAPDSGETRGAERALPGALTGLRVLEMASVVAGPGISKYLADYGADVIKVEPPGGDKTRSMGWADPRDGISYFFKLVNRGKRSVVLDLKDAADLAHFRALASEADVLVENMRPGRLEKLGLDPDSLLALNPALVIARVTGFGQTGPLSGWPGFATTADAMSGLSALMGEPGNGPSLPPVAITDEVTALAGAFACLVALRHARETGEGQVIDVSLLESVFHILGPLPAVWDGIGYLQGRMGSGLPYSVPRGVYRCSDGRWVAVSTSAESVAKRVMTMLGFDGELFSSFQARDQNRAEIEARIKEWIGARPASEVIAAFEEADAAIAPVLDMRDIVEHEHFTARGALIRVDDVLMQAPIAKLSRTPGAVSHAGVERVANRATWLKSGLNAGTDAEVHGA